ncbi:hypothetical protein F52700_963 [Fusarium sp. NRRL 52700]|nr:hypothetical protein F52700_963 [Fusarium sp. NRRL 52700]
MEPSGNKRCTESRSRLGPVDKGLDEIFRFNNVRETAWEEPIEDEDGMVLVNAKQYAAFLKWKAENLEGKSIDAPLEAKSKPIDMSEKESAEPDQFEKQGSNVQSSQHDSGNRPLPSCADSSSDDEAQAWCEGFERKMSRMGIRDEFRQILKLLEMSQLMDNDMRLFELVKKKDDEERP